MRTVYGRPIPFTFLPDHLSYRLLGADLPCVAGGAGITNRDQDALRM